MNFITWNMRGANNARFRRGAEHGEHSQARDARPTRNKND